MEKDPELIQRPFLDLISASHLLEKCYGLKAATIARLESFTDQNFHIVLTDPITIDEESGQKHCDQFVLKIYNSKDSVDGNRIELSVRTMAYLSNKGFSCPQPVTNLQGKWLHLEKIFRVENDTESRPKFGLFMVVLLTFVPGEMLSSLDTVPPEICADTGRQLGRIHQLLEEFQDFNASCPSTYCSGEWSLDRIIGQKKLSHLVEDDDLRESIHNVIDLYDEHVRPVLPLFRRGLVHGDINARNILVAIQQSPSKSHGCNAVAGIIDFGDVSYTIVIFDVAIAVAEMMNSTSDHELDSARQFLLGYSSHREITDAEKDALYYLVMARQAQLVLLCLDASKSDPTNDYIMKCVGKSSSQLQKLLSMQKSDVDFAWFT